MCCLTISWGRADVTTVWEECSDVVKVCFLDRGTVDVAKCMIAAPCHRENRLAIVGLPSGLFRREHDCAMTHSAILDETIQEHRRLQANAHCNVITGATAKKASQERLAAEIFSPSQVSVAC